MATSTKKKQDKAHALQSLVPAKWLRDEYISRKFGKKRDVDVLDGARQMKMNTLIYGPTGPGKTSCVLAYAAEFGIPFYSVPCNGAIDPRQLFGSWVPTEEAGVYKWQDGPVTAMVRHGGVLLLNEVNFMPPRIAAAMYSLLDKRRTLQLIEHDEVIIAHEDFQVVADYNPDYEGTRPLNEAFKNRFAIKLYFDYDVKIEKKLVTSDALLNLANVLRTSHQAGDIQTPISTNMLIEFEDICQDLGFDFAVMNFLNAFTLDERPAVQEIIQLHKGGLEAEFLNDGAYGNEGENGDWYPTLDELKPMKVSELRGVAEDFGIDLPQGANKAELAIHLAAEIEKIKAEDLAFDSK